MEHFTPYSALFSGTLIGLAAVLLLAGSGRIAGVSGILAGTLTPTGDGRLWRWLFLGGLVIGCALVRLAGYAPELSISASTAQIIVAGLAVGVGTRLGNGCTSGHGVCGIARFSARSLVATVTFIVAGAATVFVVHHVIGGW